MIVFARESFFEPYGQCRRFSETGGGRQKRHRVVFRNPVNQSLALRQRGWNSGQGKARQIFTRRQRNQWAHPFGRNAIKAPVRDLIITSKAAEQ